MGPKPIVMVDDGDAEAVALKTLEVDTSTFVDAFHVKLSDGRVINKTRRAFGLRKATFKDGSPAMVDMRNKAYQVGPNGAFYNGEPKLTKAEKKAMKRLKVKERRAATA